MLVKVHIKNFDSFIDYMIKKYNDKVFDQEISFSKIKETYSDYDNSINDNLYLYLSIDDTRYGLNYYYYLRRMCCTVESFNYFENCGWLYQGEFNGRKDKLKRLNELSKIK